MTARDVRGLLETEAGPALEREAHATQSFAIGTISRQLALDASHRFLPRPRPATAAGEGCASGPMLRFSLRRPFTSRPIRVMVRRASPGGSPSFRPRAHSRLRRTTALRARELHAFGRR